MQLGRLILICLLPFWIKISLANDLWTINLTPQAVTGSYPGSPIRNRLDLYGALLDFQYLDRFGFTVGDNRLNLDYKYDIPRLEQDIGYLSYRHYLTPDGLPGTLTLRMDGYQIWGNDPTGETDHATILNPIVSFLDYKQTYYLDLGYAYSDYGTSLIARRDLNLSQVTATAGFSFFEAMNWFYFRLYGIHSSNPLRSNNLSETYGGELTLVHYIIPPCALIPQQVQFGVFLGERIYAVDSTARIVYNLGDLQKTSIYAQARWFITPNVSFTLNAGTQNFETLFYNVNQPYRLNYVFGALNFRI